MKAIKIIAFAITALIAVGCKSNKTSDTQNVNKSPIMKVENYKLVWSEDFEGELLNEQIWNRQVEKAGRFNQEWQRYTDNLENAYLSDGKLIIKTIHEGDFHSPGKYTSARLNTAQKKTFKYGKIVSRIKLPKGNGIWPAFWTLGANIDENGGDTKWPECGEIDILELYGTKSNAVVEANAHFANSQNNHENMGAKDFHLKQGIFADGFHEFALEWNETKLIWSLDGQAFATMDISDKKKFSEFHHEHFLLLNIAVGGQWSGSPDETTSFPQTMEVDWIRCYEKA